MTGKYDGREGNIAVRHISGYINSINETKTAYLFFLVILNIALYAFIYYLNEGQFPTADGSNLFFIFTAVMFNWIFSALIIREFTLQRLSGRWLDENLSEKDSETLADYRECLNGNARALFSSWTAIKLLLAFFNAAPLSAIVCLTVFNGFEKGEIAVIFLSALFLMTGAAYIVLSCYSGEAEKQGL